VCESFVRSLVVKQKCTGRFSAVCVQLHLGSLLLCPVMSQVLPFCNTQKLLSHQLTTTVHLHSTILLRRSFRLATPFRPIRTGSCRLRTRPSCRGLCFERLGGGLVRGQDRAVLGIPLGVGVADELAPEEQEAVGGPDLVAASVITRTEHVKYAHTEYKQVGRLQRLHSRTTIFGTGQTCAAPEHNPTDSTVRHNQQAYLSSTGHFSNPVDSVCNTSFCGSGSAWPL
jgi:hypothetical protein